MIALRRRPASTADATREYLGLHPSLREGLQDDLLNYTALARRILAECDLRNEEAVTIAVRRFQRGLATGASEPSIRAVLARSRIEVESGLAVVRVRDDWEILDRLLEVGRHHLAGNGPRRVFQLYQGTVAITVLCEEGLLATLLPEVPARARVGVERGLAAIALRSEPRVAETPGVVAFLVEALYRRGINCLETVSVHTDSIFVFREADVIPAYQVLGGLLAAAAPAGERRASRSEQSAAAGDPKGTPPSKRGGRLDTSTGTRWRAQRYSAPAGTSGPNSSGSSPTTRRSK